MGGNKRLWDFLKQYSGGLEQKPIQTKYASAAAAYYRRKLGADASNQPFSEKEPPKNAEEYLDRGVEGAKSVAKSAGEGIAKVGNVIGEKFQESGITEKFKVFFSKKWEKIDRRNQKERKLVRQALIYINVYKFIIREHILLFTDTY